MADPFNNDPRWKKDNDHDESDHQGQQGRQQNSDNDYHDDDDNRIKSEDELRHLFGLDDNGGNNNNNNGNYFNEIPLPPNYAKVKNAAGDLRIAKVGFSWTTLWFGPLPAAFRGDWYNFILILVLDLDYALVALFFKWYWMIQFPWPALFFGAFYNMMYFRHLFNRGYVPADQRSERLLKAAHYLK